MGETGFPGTLAQLVCYHCPLSQTQYNSKPGKATSSTMLSVYVFPKLSYLNLTQSYLVSKCLCMLVTLYWQHHHFSVCVCGSVYVCMCAFVNCKCVAFFFPFTACLCSCGDICENFPCND